MIAGDDLRTEHYIAVFSIVIPSNRSVNLAIYDRTTGGLLDLVNVGAYSSLTYSNLRISVCHTQPFSFPDDREEACIKIEELPIISPVRPPFEDITYDLVLEEGWNLASFPVIGPYVDKLVLNNPRINVYQMEEGKYRQPKTIEGLTAYWIYLEKEPESKQKAKTKEAKTTEAKTKPKTEAEREPEKEFILSLEGDCVCEGRINLTKGWNGIGVPYNRDGGFSKEQIEILQNAGATNFYTYNMKTKQYEKIAPNPNSFELGKGYFVFSEREGSVFIPKDEACGRPRPTTPGCGDGIVQTELGENCDDGNTINGDGCSENCLIECGDVNRADIMLAIDKSGSMDDYLPEWGTKMAAVKRAAQNFVYLLNPSIHRVGVVEFNHSSSLRWGLTNNLLAVRSDINHINADGGTFIGAGIQCAQNEIEENAFDESVHIILLLSDGADSSAEFATWTLERADEAKANGTLIYTIAFGEDADTEALRTVSSGEGYYFYSSESFSELESIYEDIRGDIPDCCGDGVHNEGEDCDPLDPATMGRCNDRCTWILCGDHIVEGSETCDPPGTLMGSGYICREDCTYCGDNNTDTYWGETCDPVGSDLDLGFGFSVPCLAGCRACGDGIVQTEWNETCDPPWLEPIPGNICRPDDCTYCGDNITQTIHGEECDDYFTESPSGLCAVIDALPYPFYTCRWASCGNGITESPSETCDGEPWCREDCTYCGDGIWNAVEECELSLASDFSWMENCTSNCTYCGNGIVDSIHIDGDYYYEGELTHIVYDYEEECDPLDPITGPGCFDDCTLRTYCGDNITQYPNDYGEFETCDGEPWCREDCTYCGDSIVQTDWNETCEPALDPECRPDCTKCGDGTFDALYEECDDGDYSNYNECLNNCSLSFCGDGFIQSPNGYGSNETCELHMPFCRDDCTWCGDGLVNGPEECDDGNLNENDLCLSSCTWSFCGDGYVQAPNGLNGFMEECEPPGTIGCFDNCTLYPPIYCGDYDIDPGESCDPPGSTDWGPNNDTCREDCTFCGDGTTQAPYGEECDDANANQNDSCLNDCTNNVCGDEILNEQQYKMYNPLLTPPFVFLPYETCDPPGQTMPSDNVCRDDCKYCGDGYIQSEMHEVPTSMVIDPETGRPPFILLPYETCELPNTILPTGEYCRSDCSYCGDGYVQPTITDYIYTEPGYTEYGSEEGLVEVILYDGGETCDPPGALISTFPHLTYCRNDCTYCGDGIIQTWNNETCDGEEYCEGYCGWCGDGVVTGPEECDDMDDDNFNNCTNYCTIAKCGDGIIQTFLGETCDGEPYCREDCTYCGDGIIQPRLGFWIMTPSGHPEYIIYYEGETCEPLLNISCREDCTMCGDGFIDEEWDETCDGGFNCREDCTYCGDGNRDRIHGEECDDGNYINTDVCLNNCTRPFCGDGYVQTGAYIEEDTGDLIVLNEECDPASP
ncbi:hypothetical protein DRN85_08305, partial [Methanosarcinales archaeon]